MFLVSFLLWMWTVDTGVYCFFFKDFWCVSEKQWGTTVSTESSCPFHLQLKFLKAILPHVGKSKAWSREPENATYLKLSSPIHISDVNLFIALDSGISKLASFLCPQGQQSLMWSGLNLPNNNYFSGTTEFLPAISAFFHTGLATHLDIARCCGLINMTDLKYFHLCLGNTSYGDSCLFIDFTYFNTWSFPGDLFWRYSNVQL